MTDFAHFAALMDCLHEAAFVPDGWPAALDKVSALAGCDKAALIAISILPRT